MNFQDRPVASANCCMQPFAFRRSPNGGPSDPAGMSMYSFTTLYGYICSSTQLSAEDRKIWEQLLEHGSGNCRKANIGVDTVHTHFGRTNTGAGLSQGVPIQLLYLAGSNPAVM